MYTQQIRRNKSNVFMQMHTLGSSQNIGLTKLGSSIKSCMDSLQLKKQEILKTTNISKLPSLLIEFKKQHTHFLDLQKNFFQLDQTTPETQRLKIKIKDFLQSIKIEQIQGKLSRLHMDKVRQNQRVQTLHKAQKGVGNQLLLDTNQQMMRQRLLQEQSQQLKIIQKLISDIKNIAIKTSSLIYQQGVNLNIAAQTIKSAKAKFQQSKEQLTQANKYQQDTNRKKIFMCVGLVLIVIVLMMIVIAAKK